MIDKIIEEPLGGAHRDMKAISATLKRELAEAYRQIQDTPIDELIAARQEKWLSYGQFKDVEQAK